MSLSPRPFELVDPLPSDPLPEHFHMCQQCCDNKGTLIEVRNLTTNKTELRCTSPWCSDGNKLQEAA